MALATLYLCLLIIKFSGSNWNSDGTIGMFWKTSLFNWFAAVTCCSNHVTNFNFSGSNWNSNCTAGTFSKTYLRNRFAAVTCCSNQVTDYSTFHDPRETPMAQQVRFSKTYLCQMFLVVTCSSNKVTDNSGFQDPDVYYTTLFL